jgi:hypothetical protein
MSGTIPQGYEDAPWNQPVEPPKLRRASNNFRHGLYSKGLAYNTPDEQDLYLNILHNFTEEYRPVGPSECALVQELSAYQFRYQKVQSLYAEAMREEVLRQCQNAAPDAAGNAPTERTVEMRAFFELAKQPAFQLFTRELDRIPSRIQRIIKRLYDTIHRRHEAANWPDLPATNIFDREATTPVEAPLKIEKSEATAKPEESKDAPGDPMAPWKPEPILTKEKFWQIWPGLKPFTKEVLLDTSDLTDYRRKAFFEWTRLTEQNMWQWLNEGPDEADTLAAQESEASPIAA